MNSSHSSSLSILGERIQKEGLLLATGNPHKVQEMRIMLAPLKILVRSISELSKDSFVKDPSSLSFIEEKGPDFQSNASIKAQAYSEATGCISLADDSGLLVDVLGGRPGVHSARYGGPGLEDKDRNLLLLKELKGVPFQKRSARFVCVLALCLGERKQGKDLFEFFEGKCEGYITEEIQGENGFGYDPVFFDPQLKQSFAQIQGKEKNKRSHRSRAIKKFISHLYAS